MRRNTLQGRGRLAQILIAGLLATLALISAPAGAQDGGLAWVGTWATAPVLLPPPPEGAAPGRALEPVRIQNQTLRQIVHTSTGGSAVRVAVTNLYGGRPLEVGAARVARRIGRDNRPRHGPSPSLRRPVHDHRPGGGDGGER